MRADEFLRDQEVSFRLVEQGRPTTTCHGSASQRGVSQSQIVKSLLVERDGTELHVLLPGDRQLRDDLDWTLVEDDRVEELSGFEPGTVHPFSTDRPRVVDERVLEQDELSFTTGDPEQGVVIEAEAFQAILEDGFDVELADISQGEFPEAEELMETYDLDRSDAMFITQQGERDRFERFCEALEPEQAAETVRFIHRAAADDDRQMDRLPDHQDERWEELLDADRERRRSGIVALLEGDELQDADHDLDAVVADVIEDEPEAVADLRSGTDSALNYLVGQVMQRTQGGADPQQARERIRDAVDG